ncbi:MAG: hypothetical protein ABJB05_16450 [Parafilimonas sp.]
MKAKSTLLVVLNTLSFIIALFVNYIVQTHTLTNIAMAEVSHKYNTLFAPADYAFLIWLVIYIMCACFIIYQWIILKNDVHQYIQKTGIWFTAVNLLNALWCYCWIHEWLGWCVIIMLALLICLITLTIRLRLEMDDEPVKAIFFVWWPITYYLGWIITATVACIASWLVYAGWSAINISPETWTVIMIAIACLIYIFLIRTRNMREAASVGIWAFIAIAVRQWNDYRSIAEIAIIASIILLIAISIHANKNKYYSPFLKMKRGEW